MDPDENALRSAPAYDDHEARITKQEKAVVDLQYELALFRQQTDSNFEALRVQIASNHMQAELQLQAGLAMAREAINDKIAQERKSMDEAMLKSIAELAARVDRIESKVEFLTKWLVASQVTIISFVITLAAQAFLP
jgi:hypothetical protein